MGNKGQDVEIQIQAFEKPDDLKVVLYQQHMKQITNFFKDEKEALKFLSSVVADVQKTPALLDCEPVTVINSYMTMAQLGLMPSGVSGEAYVLPYKKGGNTVIAQFQLGYQGLVTLFYRAGVREIVAEIVREKDKFSVVNGKVNHEADYFSDRGAAKGAYVIVTLQAGGQVSKVMSKEEIMQIGKKFSKSFTSEYSPWNEKNDPQLHMWRKTVLKQCAKLVPKNETIYKAIAEDNEDSEFAGRFTSAKKESEDITMGSLLKAPDAKKNIAKETEAGTDEAHEASADTTK
jgi:recombination protein RecT